MYRLFRYKSLAKANNPTADFEVMDCRETDKLQTRFDGIVCGFCLPYLSAPDSSKFIKDCSNLLYDSGVLYISFVEGDYAQSGFQTGSSGDRIYFYFHTIESLAKEFANNHLETILSVNKTYTNRHSIEEVHTIIIAKK